MEIQALKDEQSYPDDHLLKKALGQSFEAFRNLASYINQPDSALSMEWRYYKDGKAWLCKVSAKKKTVFWLSAWNGFFKIGFYFSEKTGTGVEDLAINPSIKKDFRTAKPIGKLFPLIISVQHTHQVEDLIKLMNYKQGLK